MAIVQRPDALSLSGNLKNFIVNSGSKVPFSLELDGKSLFEFNYEPDKNGVVEIDVQDIIESNLYFILSHANFYEQSFIAQQFSAKIESETYTFKVLRCGVANLADTPSNWLKINFLTWQPISKAVTYHSPEWLTYYATENCTLKLKAYFADKTEQVISLGNLSAGKAYTANLQYAVVAGLLGQKYPTHYDVRVENASSQLSYIQQYHYSDLHSEDEQWYLFENSLGGIDTIRAYGQTDFSGEHSHQIATNDNFSAEFRIDSKRLYNQNTGHLTVYERRWLLDFFPAFKKYVFVDSAFRQITVVSNDVKYNSADLPSNFSFKYRFADDCSSYLLNLIRNQDAIPADITLPNLDSPNFIIPPRLSEYPRLPLSEGVIIPAHQPNSEKTGVTTIGAILEAAIAAILALIQGGNAGGELVDILRLSDLRKATDFNVFSAIRTIKEITDRSISKIDSDTAQKIITFLEGIFVGDFKTGPLGSGGAFRMNNGISEIEVDKLTVRMMATFYEIVISKLSHIGGQLILTPARMKCIRVEEMADSYRCYFDRGENNEVVNEFVKGDQARCQVFSGSGTKFYWRLVTAIGDNYIELSKTDRLGDSIPDPGDDISQLGNRDNPARQNAQILSTVGDDAPSWKQYSGIDSFNLVGKERTVFSGKGNSISSETIFMADGSTLKDWDAIINDKIDNINVGATNLLLNTGFLGDFQAKNIDEITDLISDTDLGTNPLVHWVHDNAKVIDAPSRSGKGALIGNIKQTVNLLANQDYIFTVWAKGHQMNVSLDGTQSQNLTDEYQKYVFRFKPTQTKAYTFEIDGTAVSVYELMLSEGTNIASYNFAPEDDLKAIEQLKAIGMITDAIKEYDTSILGGLILTSMLQLGKYKDGKMQQVNAGMNGIYNNDNDPAFWAGGTLDDAIRTMTRIKNNPTDITDEEWKSLANIVLSHGGDGVFRGFIYALGGIFRGRVETNNKGDRIVLDPDKRVVELINSDNKSVFKLSFDKAESPSFGWALMKFTSAYETALAEVTTESTISTSGIKSTYINNAEHTTVAEMTADHNEIKIRRAIDDDDEKELRFEVIPGMLNDGLFINMKGLYSSGSSLPKYTLFYESDGTLKLKL